MAEAVSYTHLPVVSSGVRVRIKESDLPHALKITESSAWLSEEVVGGKSPKLEKVDVYKRQG